MRKLSEIRREIRTRWPEIHAASGVLPCTLPESPTLLGTGTKTDMGQGLGYLVKVVYMSPDREAFVDKSRTLCPLATLECSRGCLGHSAGRMIQKPQLNARLWKTALYMGNRALYRELLDAEALAFTKAATRKGYQPRVRVDGSTDTGEGRLLVKRTGVRGYDYTKVHHRLRLEAPVGYTRCLSFSGSNEAECLEALADGHRVAVVFATRKGEALPESWNGFPVVNGDEHDLIELQPEGHVIGLRFKSARDRAAAMATMGRFVQPDLAT